MTLKMAVLAPIPRANMLSATAVNAGLLLSPRSARFASERRSSSQRPPRA